MLYSSFPIYLIRESHQLRILYSEFPPKPMKLPIFRLSLGALLLFVTAHVSVALGQSGRFFQLDPLQPIVVNRGKQPSLKWKVVSFELKRPGYPSYSVKGNQVPLSYLQECKSTQSYTQNDTVFVRKVVYVKGNKSNSKNVKRRFIDEVFGYFLLASDPPRN
jgi:hypothetical protein